MQEDAVKIDCWILEREGGSDRSIRGIKMLNYNHLEDLWTIHYKVINYITIVEPRFYIII